MAIFGDLGKALGLGSAKELLPTIGAAAGFYFGGPMGASIGSGIGSLAGGKSVNDALTNAALAYGVTSFVSPNMMSSSAKSSTGMFGPNALQNKLYGIEQVANPSTLVGNLNEGMTTGAGKSSGLGGLFDDFTMKDAFLVSSLGGAALQALDKPEEGTPQRDPIGGTILGSVSSPTTDKVYDVTNPIEMAEYNEEISKFYDDDFKYEVEEPVRAAHGGAMYGHDKMGYDTPITGEVSGPGTGTSDSVPARLSDGEFVLTADAVRGAGGGDRDVGAARLYDMMSELEATA
jgi:hypothetical protein|tara:strand:+ start:216 stop:1082 length:867 start_codon:yes stop_codon:yes gene_type:complete